MMPSEGDTTMTDTPRRSDPLPPIILGGSINILAGASGTGKTALLVQWAVAFRDRAMLLGHQCQPVADIGVITADRAWETGWGERGADEIQYGTRRWFELAGWPEIPHYSLQDDPTFKADRLDDKKKRVGILYDAFGKLKLRPYSVCIIDPVTPFLGGDLNNYDACFTAMTKLRGLTRDLKLTIIGGGHAGKQTADPKRRYLRPQDRIAGSTALLGYSDTQMYLSAPCELGPHATHYALDITGHHAPPTTWELDRLPNGLFSEPVAAALPADAPQTFPRADLLSWMPERPQDTDFARLLDIAVQDTRLNVGERQLRRWLKELIDEGVVERTSRGRYCRVTIN